MTSPVSDLELKGLFSGLVKQAIIWAPIVVGVVHQILMYLFNIDSIYIFLTPPGYISPFVSLEAGWWLVLTFGTSLFCLLVYINRIRPRRVIYPLYLYLIFLLIWVKPV